MTWSGTRTFLRRMRSNVAIDLAARASPSSIGICRPSSKTSFASAERILPPMSGECATEPAKPTMRPSRKIGFATVMSGRWPVPVPDVVGDEDVAGLERLERKLLEEMPDRARHGADERRHAVGRLRDRLPLRVGQHAREVVRLAHDGRERRALQRRRGLVGDRDEPRPDHLERDGVERGVSSEFLLPTCSSLPHNRLRRAASIPALSSVGPDARRLDDLRLHDRLDRIALERRLLASRRAASGPDRRSAVRRSGAFMIASRSAFSLRTISGGTFDDTAIV